jgi:hypothetical protein
MVNCISLAELMTPDCIIAEQVPTKLMLSPRFTVPALSGAKRALPAIETFATLLVLFSVPFVQVKFLVTLMSVPDAGPTH